MMIQPSIQIRRAVVALLPVVLIVGCASSKKEHATRAQLERARSAYRQAEADPNVQAYAQLRLGEAQRAIQAAEAAKDLEEKQHLAYVAEKRAMIASIAAATTKMEQDALQLSRESSEVLLQKRDRELKAALAQARPRAADSSAREAEQARMQAEQARLQAEEARSQAEAEAKARAAEQAKAAALMKELSELRAQQTDRGLVLTVGDVHFAAGKAEVAPGGQRSVDQLVQFLKTYPRRRVLIEGHTDNTGNEDFNVKLSQQRADAVRSLLVARGIAPERIATRGYGPKYPIVENDTPAGRQQNRRVEVLVLNEAPSADGGTR
ncbi:MAG: flagellar motor protein MotB [Candidatus Rokuibacteriota bacterium]|nr:MAG: flagellar motor protein MotB [Candidatus Rokubacteria bacterium]